MPSYRTEETKFMCARLEGSLSDEAPTRAENIASFNCTCGPTKYTVNDRDTTNKESEQNSVDCCVYGFKGSVRGSVSGVLSTIEDTEM